MKERDKWVRAYEAGIQDISLDDLRETVGKVGDRYFVTPIEAPCDHPLPDYRQSCEQVGCVAEFLACSCAGNKPGWHLFCIKSRDGELKVGCSGPLDWYSVPEIDEQQPVLFGSELLP